MSQSGSTASALDLLSAGQLHDLLYPAAKKVADYASRNEYVARAKDSFNEVFYLGALLPIQLAFLLKRSATVTEHIYGVKRVATSGDSLGAKGILASVLETVLYPYFQTKVAEESDRLFHDDTGRVEGAAYKKTISALSLLTGVIFPMASLIQSIRYMSGGSSFYSPAHWLFGTNHQGKPNNQGYTLGNFLRSVGQVALLGLGSMLVASSQGRTTTDGVDDTPTTSAGHTVPVLPPPPPAPSSDEPEPGPVRETRPVGRASMDFASTCLGCQRHVAQDYGGNLVMPSWGQAVCMDCIRRVIGEGSTSTGESPTAEEIRFNLDKLIRPYMSD